MEVEVVKMEVFFLRKWKLKLWKWKFVFLKNGSWSCKNGSLFFEKWKLKLWKWKFVFFWKMEVRFLNIVSSPLPSAHVHDGGCHCWRRQRCGIFLQTSKLLMLLLSFESKREDSWFIECRVIPYRWLISSVNIWATKLPSAFGRRR